MRIVEAVVESEPYQSPTDAFAAWYRQLAPRLSRVLVVMTGDADLARDLTAEACARTWQRWERLTSAGAMPDGWAFQVAMNLLKRHKARQPSEAITEADGAAAIQADPDPELWRAVQALPLRQRQTIVLRYLGDLSEREIGAVLGVSEGAVSASLTKARKSLSRELGVGDGQHG